MMRKKWMTAVSVLTMICALTGCGKSDVKIADMGEAEVEKYVVLPDYKNLDVAQVEKPEITDADVKYNVYHRIDAVSEMHELTGTVEDGDVVNIDYAGTIDGTAFQGGTAQAQLLEIGSGSFIEGFEEGLIGANVGETKELYLKFDDNYGNPDVAGKDCVFAVKINHILSELTDENVSLVDPGYQNAAEYWEDAKTMLVDYVEDQYRTQLKQYIATSLVAGCTYEEVPESLVEDYRESLGKDFENMASSAGVTAEEYIMNAYSVTADGVEDKLDEIALRCAREGLAVQAVANAEGMSVSDEEVDQAIADYTAAGAAEEELDRDIIKINLLYNKVYDFLVELYGE